MKKRIELAKSKGASLVIYSNNDLEKKLKKYDHYYSKAKMSLVDSEKSEFIIIQAGPELSEAIFMGQKTSYKKLLAKSPKKIKSFTTNISLDINKPIEELKSENVLAFIPGTDKKDEIVVITAHYDHIGKNDSVVFNLSLIHI